MPLYMMMAKSSEKTRLMCADDEQELVRKTHLAHDEYGSNFITMYAALGRYDYMIITEAHDNNTVARMSIEISNATGLNLETMPIVPTGLHDSQANPQPEETAPVREPRPDPQPARSTSATQTPTSRPNRRRPREAPAEPVTAQNSTPSE